MELFGAAKPGYGFAMLPDSTACGAGKPSGARRIVIDSGIPGGDEIGSSGKQQASIKKFEFHGNGADYFRIWIVNLLLSILTLGIYSAWAKVRSKQYFYGNTELAGDRFEYLADPVAILKGRLIAVAALLAYTYASYLSLLAAPITLLLLLLLIPPVVVQSLRFNASNSAWRGVRFGFDGGIRQAYPPHFFWPLFGVATFGIGLPFALYKINRFQYNNYRFGAVNSTSSATALGFYGIGLGVLLAIMLAFFLTSVSITLVYYLFGISGGEELPESPELLAAITLFPAYFIFYICVAALYQAMSYRLVFNNLAIGDNRLRNSISIGYIGVILVNSILIVATLGFFYPWAAVRRARYLLSNMRVEAADLDTFIAGELDHVSARGEEFGEAFDLGIGF